MDYAEAKETLLLHSCADATDERAKMQTGFVGSLRPFRGLRDENYHEVMSALAALAPKLREPVVDRELMSALWAICVYSRAWGVDPNGMLRRNKLISDEDVAKLERWINTIGYAVNGLLDGADVETAFEPYRRGASFP